MIKKNQRILNTINVITDGVIVLLCYLFASWFWLDLLRGDPLNIANVISLRQGVVFAAFSYAAAMMLILAFLGIYSPARIRRFKHDVIIIVEANLIGALSIGAILYLFRLQDFSRGVLGVFFLTSSLALCAKRYLLRQALTSMRRRGLNQKHVVVVGTGRLAQQYAQSIANAPGFGFQIDGYIGGAGEGASSLQPLLGGFDRLDDLLRTPGIDEVVIALEPEENDHILPAITLCEKNGTKVGIIPFYNDIIPSHPTIEIIGQSKLISLRSNPLDNVGFAFLKRTFDVVMSILFMALLSPLMLLAVLGVKCSSPGPILFKQDRVGLNKRVFSMLKFRSMRINAEESSGWTTGADPRRTKFGSFLRKFSIDELPQLINVLRGDMSLVGPRPEIPYYVDHFRESIPLYMVKHQVRPGLTGWAQVNGFRGDTSIEERIRHDIWYIENWSAGLDLKILIMTVFGAWMNDERVFSPRKKKP